MTSEQVTVKCGQWEIGIWEDGRMANGEWEIRFPKSAKRKRAMGKTSGWQRCHKIIQQKPLREDSMLDVY